MKKKLFAFIVLLLLSASAAVGQNAVSLSAEDCTPAVYTLSGGGAYCAGTGGMSLTLNGSDTGISYQLYKDGTAEGTSVTGTGALLTWNNLLAGTYTVTATNDTNQTSTALMNPAVSIVENQLPVVFAGYDQITYFWGTPNLSATVTGGSGHYAYQWTPAILVTNPTAQSTTTIPLTSSTPFIVSVYDSVSTCTQSDTVIIIITCCMFNVTAQAQPNPVCAGDTVFLSANAVSGTGTYSYSWTSIPAGFSANVKDTFALPVVNTRYIITANDGTMLSTDTADVAISQITAYTLCGGGAYCAGSGGLTLAISGSQTGVNYQLYKNGIACGLPVAGSGNGLSWPHMLAGTYTLAAAYATAPYCTATMNGNVEIIENPLPVVDAGSDQLGWWGQSVTLNAVVTLGSGVYSYQWTPANLIVNDTSQSTATIALTSSHQFIVYVTDSVTSCTQSDSVNVIVYCCGPSVNATVQPSAVCIGDTVHLSAVTEGGSGSYSYNWSSEPPGFSATVQNPVAIPTVNTTYIVVVNDGTQTVSASVSVAITSNLDVFYLNSYGYYCSGDSGGYVTTNGSELGISYQLYKNETVWGVPLYGTGSSLVWDTLYEGVYKVLAYDSSLTHCNYYFTNNIGLIRSQTPWVNLGSDTTLCLNQNLLLTGPSGTGYSYLWLKLPDDTLTNFSSVLLNPAINDPGMGTYILTAKNSNNCVDADTINVTFTSCVSVSEYNDLGIKVYPNPAKGYVSIDWDKSLMEKANVEMIDIYGRVVFSNELNSRTNKINLQGFSTGVYFIRITSGTAIYTSKLIIEK